MSVIGSVIVWVLGVGPWVLARIVRRYLTPNTYHLIPIYYQLDLVTPGISPLLANSLKHILQRPNFLIKPCLLPHLKQRLCSRVENFGFICAFASCDVLAIMLLLRKRNSKL